MLESRIKEDMVKFLKSGEKEKLTVIRMVKGAVDLEHINTKKCITDDLIIDVLNKQIKMRNDSVVEFEKARRDDLSEKTKAEIDILMEYLPEQLSEGELNDILNKVFNDVKPEGMQDMGKVMKEINPLVKGKADMSKVSELIKAKLQKD
jgi:uncharacterized protein YqeY